MASVELLPEEKKVCTWRRARTRTRCCMFLCMIVLFGCDISGSASRNVAARIVQYLILSAPPTVAMYRIITTYRQNIITSLHSAHPDMSSADRHIISLPSRTPAPPDKHATLIHTITMWFHCTITSPFHHHIITQSHHHITAPLHRRTINIPSPNNSHHVNN